MVFRNSTKTKRCLVAGALVLALGVPPVIAQPVRIDLGMDTGRSDTAKAGWHEWQIPAGSSARTTIDGLDITLRPGKGTADEIEGAWFKSGLAYDAAMATDGVVVRGQGDEAVMEIVMEGLAPGQHSLVTWHNLVDDGEAAFLTLEVDGTVDSTRPTRKILRDGDAASLYVEFEVKTARPVVARLTGKGEGRGLAILNGLEIDGSDPLAKARDPQPERGDLHVDADDSRIVLSWNAAASAKMHRLYYTTADDAASAVSAVYNADAASPLWRGTFPQSRFEVNVEGGNSLLHHAWRVDSIDADGKVTRGDVWTFRVRHLAFPGAEGYGRFAIGGRGGRVIKVTNLNDSGPGSLRAAIEAEGPRTVVFDISGRIVLEDKLVIRNPFITIAGQTAPGKGICISNYNLGMLGTHDVIIRHIRVRPGDTAGKTLDGMGMASSDHAIIDHCSISWTQDEAFSSRGAKNITLQRTLISEALNIAGHKKYEAGKQHGFAASISGDIGSFHHNLLAHCAGRNWSLAGGLDKANRHAGRLDIRNNVVYNWGYRTTDGGAREVNFVNNYYKPGPATTVFHVLKPERKLVGAFGPQDYYVSGNVMEGHYGPEEPFVGVAEESEEPKESFLVEEPFFPAHVTTETAAQAYKSVLADVGANVPMLDEHDQRVIEETRKGTATYAGGISGMPGLPDSQEDVGGWEDYPVVRRPDGWDTDDDGMPDGWESQSGLDPENPADGLRDNDGDGYTNLEEFLNWLAAGNRMEELSR